MIIKSEKNIEQKIEIVNKSKLIFLRYNAKTVKELFNY